MHKILCVVVRLPVYTAVVTTLTLVAVLVLR